MAKREMNGAGCNCWHHKFVPMLIVLFGLVFLLNAMNMLVSDTMLAYTWPILVILAGVTKYIGKSGMCSCGCTY